MYLVLPIYMVYTGMCDTVKFYADDDGVLQRSRGDSKIPTTRLKRN